MQNLKILKWNSLGAATLFGAYISVFQFIYIRLVTLQVGSQAQYSLLTVTLSSLGFSLGYSAYFFARSHFKKNFVTSFKKLGKFIVIVEFLFLAYSLQIVQFKNSFYIFAILLAWSFLCGAASIVLLQHFFEENKKNSLAVVFFNLFTSVGTCVGAVLFFSTLVPQLGMQLSLIFIIATRIFILSFFVRQTKDAISTNPDSVLKTVSPSIEIELFYLFLGFIFILQQIYWLRLHSIFSGADSNYIGKFVVLMTLGLIFGNFLTTFFPKRWLSDIAIFSLVANLLFFSYGIFVLFYDYKEIVLFKSNYIYLLTILCFFFLAIAFNTSIKAHFIDPNKNNLLTRIHLFNSLGILLGIVYSTGYALNNHSLPFNIKQLSFLGFFIVFFKIQQQYTVKRILAIVSVFLVSSLSLPVPARFFEKLILKENHQSFSFSVVMENSYGVLALAPSPNGDILFGSGMYDGRFNVDPIMNANEIDRAYMAILFRGDFGETLQIGLGTGSWSRVFLSHKSLKNLTVLEINPAYLDLLHHRRETDLLNHPKISFEFADARIWLRDERTKKFDFILMNTSYYWRHGINNLVSREFLELCKSRLNPSGVMYFNTTGSEDIIFTASTVFRYVARYKSFIAVSDQPFSFPPKSPELLFEKYEKLSVSQMDHLKELPIPFYIDSSLLNISQKSYPKLITDDNLRSELTTNRRHWYTPIKAY